MITINTALAKKCSSYDKLNITFSARNDTDSGCIRAGIGRSSFARARVRAALVCGGRESRFSGTDAATLLEGDSGTVSW